MNSLGFLTKEELQSELDKVTKYYTKTLVNNALFLNLDKQIEKIAHEHEGLVFLLLLKNDARIIEVDGIKELDLELKSFYARDYEEDDKVFWEFTDNREAINAYSLGY